MPVTAKDTTDRNAPALDELCAWIAADGPTTTRITEAEMAQLIYRLAIELAVRLRGRLDLGPVSREDAIEAAHAAASCVRHVRTLVERQDGVNVEQMEHRYDPPVPVVPQRVDLGDDGAVMELGHG